MALFGFPSAAYAHAGHPVSEPSDLLDHLGDLADNVADVMERFDEERLQDEVADPDELAQLRDDLAELFDAYGALIDFDGVTLLGPIGNHVAVCAGYSYHQFSGNTLYFGGYTFCSDVAEILYTFVYLDGPPNYSYEYDYAYDDCCYDNCTNLLVQGDIAVGDLNPGDYRVTSHHHAYHDYWDDDYSYDYFTY